MWRDLHEAGIDMLDYLRQNPSQVKIDRHQNIAICYVHVLDGMGSLQTSFRKTTGQIQCRLLGTIFQRDSNSTMSGCLNFDEMFEFPNDVAYKLSQIKQIQKDDILRQLHKIKMVQVRLPAEFHDYSTFDSLIMEYQQLEKTQLKNIKCKFYYDDLVILYCGNYLKFGRLIKKKKNKKGHNVQLKLDKIKGN